MLTGRTVGEGSVACSWGLWSFRQHPLSNVEGKRCRTHLRAVCGSSGTRCWAEQLTPLSPCLGIQFLVATRACITGSRASSGR